MNISSIILAGGRATRMGGADKGLVKLQQKLLIEHVINRLILQVDEIIINANRGLAQYSELGYPVIQDEMAGFVGPLAGIALGLAHAKHEYVLVVPCDSPLLPLDLAARLFKSLQVSNADIAVATSDGDAHPVFCLCKKNTLPSLNNYMHQDGRKVSAWQKSQRYVEVDFSDNAAAFINLNTLEDVSDLENLIALENIN